MAVGDELARRFFEVAAGGNLDELLGMLAPDVLLHGDGGGKTRAISRGSSAGGRHNPGARREDRRPPAGHPALRAGQVAVGAAVTCQGSCSW